MKIKIDPEFRDLIPPLSDEECLVVDGTGEDPWSAMLDLLPKFKKAELQKLHDLLETDFGCHPAAASNEGRAS